MTPFFSRGETTKMKWLKRLFGKPYSFKSFIEKAKKKDCKTIFLSSDWEFSPDIGGVDNFFNAHARTDTGIRYTKSIYAASFSGTLASTTVKGVMTLYSLLKAWKRYLASEGFAVVLEADNLKNKLGHYQRHGWFKNYEAESEENAKSMFDEVIDT